MSVSDDIRAAPTKSAKVHDAKLSDPRLIRSLIRCQPSDPADRFHENILAVREAGLGFSLAEDETLWGCVDAFEREHEHAPELTTVTDKMREGGELGLGAADRLESLLATRPAWGGDFRHLIDLVRQEQKRNELAIVIKDAVTIATAGMEVGQGRNKKILRGPEAAAAYAWERMGTIAAPPTAPGLSGTPRGADVVAEYDQTERDPHGAVGRWTGIKQMDESLNGARVGELWLHAAYSGHLKTTLALNWAYNQAVWFHDNVLYFSLEMPFHQVRRWLLSMHTIHPKFTEARIALGIQQEGGPDVGLDYKKIRDGGLAPVEKRFLVDYVTTDWDDPANGYGTIHVEVADPSKPDITVDGLRGRAEGLYSKVPFGMVVVDHASLLGSRGRYTSTTERLNESLRDLKNLFALNFRRGQGIPVVALFQINREGLKEAHKRKEKGHLPTYEIHNLSYSSEAERSADVVTASYLDKEYADRSRALFTCLKARDNAPFDPCLVRVDWPSRRLGTCLDSPQHDHSDQVPPEEIGGIIEDAVAA